MTQWSPFGNLSEETQNTNSKEYIYTPLCLFISALFIIAKVWKQHECPSVDEWIKKQFRALARLLTWLQIVPYTKKVVGSIPGQGIYLGYGFDFQAGQV